MSSLSSNLNPNVVKTALDEVFYDRFDGTLHPGYVDASSPIVFNQDTTDRAAEIGEVFASGGMWGERAEEENVEQGQPQVDNKITFHVTNYAQKVVISKNFFDDNMHGVYENMVREMAEDGRVTRDTKAFKLYREAFTKTLTADGKPLIASDHQLISGEEVSNQVTGNPALSESALNDAIIQLIEQKNQGGTIRGNMPQTLLVAPKNFKLASEITESELKSGTDTNDINVYSSKYGINVATSPFLGSAAGGNDDAWFLLGTNHQVTRWVRQAVETVLVDWSVRDNNSYVYKGEFREVAGVPTHNAIVGSDGSGS